MLLSGFSCRNRYTSHPSCTSCKAARFESSNQELTKTSPAFAVTRKRIILIKMSKIEPGHTSAMAVPTKGTWLTYGIILYCKVVFVNCRGNLFSREAAGREGDKCLREISGFFRLGILPGNWRINFFCFHELQFENIANFEGCDAFPSQMDILCGVPPPG